jgi:hypothetical protein
MGQERLFDSRPLMTAAPSRLDQCQLSIGGVPWFPFAGIFGNLSTVMDYMLRHTARIIKFPASH